MYTLAEQRLSGLVNSLGPGVLAKTLIGLEKETLRVSSQGGLSQQPHPQALGSPLTHPWITTDYSEAMLELITPPESSPANALGFLRDLQTFVYGQLDDELLWATSMPCVVAGETSIPLAHYGSSNAGTMKTVYRRGLGHRYGRVMQVISGVHFNYSFPDEFWQTYKDTLEDRRPLREFVDEKYFDLIRNLLRFGWLVPYLFGASPAICKSFVGDRETGLQEFDRNTCYHPFATSLRMGDIGYQNNKENEVGVKACYDNVSAYTDSLQWATETPCLEFSKIGVKVDGLYRQLNPNILQIENEYYSTVRPKQVPEGNEKPILGLRRRGVRYVELRSLDVNSLSPEGVSEDQICFLEALMLFCLLHESPVLDERERIEIDENELNTAHRGRDPAFRLLERGRETGIRERAVDLCDAMQGVCDLLDAQNGGHAYRDSLARQREIARDPDGSPSARMLAEMRAAGEGFFHYAQRISRQHQATFRERVLLPETAQRLQDLALSSRQQQQEIEAADSASFDQYLADYFSQS